VEKALVISGILLTVLLVTVGIPVLFMYIQNKRRKKRYEEEERNK